MAQRLNLETETKVINVYKYRQPRTYSDSRGDGPTVLIAHGLSHQLRTEDRERQIVEAFGDSTLRVWWHNQHYADVYRGASLSDATEFVGFAHAR